MAKRAVRISDDLDQKIQNAAKDRGFRSSSAFIRVALESELKKRSETLAIEEQIAASFDRQSRDIRRLLRNQQALFALVDALTRVVLTCVPEPEDRVKAEAISAAKARYARLLKSAGQTMAMEVLPTMEALFTNVKED